MAITDNNSKKTVKKASEPSSNKESPKSLQFPTDTYTQLTAVSVLLQTSVEDIIVTAVNYYLKDMDETLRDNFLKQTTTSKIELNSDEAQGLKQVMTMFNLSHQDVMRAAVVEFIARHTKHE